MEGNKHMTKFNAEFLDAARRKKQKNMTEEDRVVEEMIDKEIKKRGFRKLV